MKILISGGGTGGHIFPAISIANAVRRRHPDAEVLFVGALGRMEMERVPAAGYDIVGLPVAGFDRKKLWRNFGVLVKLAKSMLKARRIVRDFKPDVAVGVGGYASGPILKEAQRRGVPTLVQEQNSYAGVTNKLLAEGADAICVAYDSMERFFPASKLVKTGNPVRATLTRASDMTPGQAREALGFDPRRPLVMMTGGSLGARTINEATARAISALTAAGAQILWQTGKLYADECSAIAQGITGVTATAFIDDMALAYRAADVVVARAGACTISELQLLGKPAVLIPSPNVAEDHQTKNAMALVERSAAVMIPDAEARERLGEAVATLIADEQARDTLSKNIAAMALRQADERIADQIDRIVNR